MKIQKDKLFVMIIDIQERLFPHILGFEELEKNLTTLTKGLRLFDIPFIVNEQYKKGLGETISPLKSILEKEKSFEKVTFSCVNNSETLEKVLELNKNIAIIIGIEAHICVLQTCLDLLEKDIQPVLVVDCIGSRKALDKEIAIQRLIQAGAIPTTSESLLFELCKSAKHPLFKEVSKLIK